MFVRSRNAQRQSVYSCIHSKSESTLELQSRVAPSVEYISTNMVQTQEAILEEGKKRDPKRRLSEMKMTLASFFLYIFKFVNDTTASHIITQSQTTPPTFYVCYLIYERPLSRQETSFTQSCFPLQMSQLRSVKI